MRGLDPRIHQSSQESFRGWIAGSSPAMTSGLLPILLDACGAQASEAVLVDGELPGQEFVDGQRVAAAGFLQRQQTAADGGNDFRLAPDHPAFGAGCRQIRDRQWTAVRPDDVFYPRAMGFCHGVLTNSQPLNSREEGTPRDLKFA